MSPKQLLLQLQIEEWRWNIQAEHFPARYTIPTAKLTL